MTLTVVVGSSGSGKTTFLNDTVDRHKAVYLRQYHAVRHYIKVSAIPRFDPRKLPYWDIYEREGTANTIKTGGTMAGEFVAGLSGGQRKLLLFELICQRTACQSDLLIVLDEPFAGVTDDFVPFIVERLNEMRKKHNILLVTNDHVDTLTKMADNTITVSAIDRTVVRINERDHVDRNKAIAALSVGDRFHYESGAEDLFFFFSVEVLSNSSLLGIVIFMLMMYALYLLTFWDSMLDYASLIIIAGEVVGFFALNPYLLSAVDWRNYMKEEAEALMHASIEKNLFLRTSLTLAFGLFVWVLEYAVINAVVDGLNTIDVFLGIFFDNLSSTLPFIIMGLYTAASHQDVEMIGSLPFLFMLFLSTAYSPGAGLPGLKELRYLFPKFYFWCFLPDVKDLMEGCPESRGELLLYLALSSFTFSFIFLGLKFVSEWRARKQTKRLDKSAEKLLDEEFEELQIEIYGNRGHEYYSKLTKKAETGRSSHGSDMSA